MSSHPLETTEILQRPASGGLLGRDLISIGDFSPHEIKEILALATLMKAHPAEFRSALAGKQVVMFFEKPSLRTRITFEAGTASLGGQAIFVDQTNGRIDARESLATLPTIWSAGWMGLCCGPLRMRPSKEWRSMLPFR